MRLVPALVLATACASPEAEPLAQVEQKTSVCAAGETTYGIDVSRFQGDIDWDLVAGSGVKYAFVQISRSLTDIDAKFPYNWRRAKEVGILRGAYQRFQPDQDVLGQAELFVQKLGPYVAGDLPPVLDVEDDKGLPPATIAAAVDEWVTYVEQHVGLKPIIYTGYYFWKDHVAADFSDHPLWIANYGSSCPLVPPSWTTWTIHQYSSQATIPGITANTVDVNRFNGTLEDLQALAAPPVCGDTYCTGGEDADTCADDCEPCHRIDSTEAGSIVDDASECFRAGGNPIYIRTENAGYGSSLQWTHATESATPSNYGRWSLHFADAGRYRVEAFTPAPYGESTKSVYQVHHGDEVTNVTVDQSAVDGWNEIGDFNFVAGGHGQFVRVDDNTGEANDSNTQIVFDALRFTRIEDAAVDPEPEPEEPGGCATTRGNGLWLVALLLALGARRKRSHRPID
jgi:GH25 family lysozyme M1 (1,4-beta-N-acetylmuramidase)